MSPDWWTVVVGCVSFAAILVTVLLGGYEPQTPVTAGRTNEIWLPGEWKGRLVFAEYQAFILMNLFNLCTCGLALFSTYRSKRTRSPLLTVIKGFLPSYCGGTLFVIGMALLSILLGQQSTLKSTGIEATIWAFAFGIIFTNCCLPLGRRLLFPAESMHAQFYKPLPQWIKISSNGEWYIKIGLVLLGIDMQTIGSLGAPGLISSWIDTPIVVVASYLFATRVLHMQDRKMAMMVSVGLAVCGSSAATAVVSVVNGSEETLVFVVALLSLFTSAQMIALPYLARTFSVNDKVIGAWFGGAIDQTGSVVVSAQIYGGQDTVDTAGLVKIIQNALIGIIAVIISVYWIRYEEPDYDYTQLAGEESKSAAQQVDLLPAPPRRVGLGRQLWVRFPKFIIGFVAISASLTVLRSTLSFEVFTLIKCILASVSKWFFIFGFVGAGLETNFFTLVKLVGNVKLPIILYLFGQSLDLLLGFAMAYLAFN